MFWAPCKHGVFLMSKAIVPHRYRARRSTHLRTALIFFVLIQAAFLLRPLGWLRTRHTVQQAKQTRVTTCPRTSVSAASCCTKAATRSFFNDTALLAILVDVCTQESPCEALLSSPVGSPRCFTCVSRRSLLLLSNSSKRRAQID